MDIIGLWKITDVNVMDIDFNQTWRKVEDMLADESVHPLQKAMAQARYLFKDDGTWVQLMPKELDRDGKFESYDDSYVIGHTAGWKEEGGKLLTEMDGNEWQEMVPDGDGFIAFSMFRIVKLQEP